MTNKELVINFLHGSISGQGSNLSIIGDKLFSYNTCIGQRKNGVVYANMTKYSTTTSRHQNYLRKGSILELSNTTIPINITKLDKFIS